MQIADIFHYMQFSEISGLLFFQAYILSTARVQSYKFCVIHFIDETSFSYISSHRFSSKRFLTFPKFLMSVST